MCACPAHAGSPGASLPVQEVSVVTDNEGYDILVVKETVGVPLHTWQVPYIEVRWCLP